MRTFMKVQVPVQRGNKAIVDGAISKVVAEFTARAKPEAAYFGAEGGLRTGYFVVDVKSSSELPALLEPFFLQLDAAIEVAPVMNGEELQAGLLQLK